MAMEYRNPSHPNHELEMKKYLKPYTCDGCKETGFGPRYRCEKCDFDLHQACMFPQMSSSSHEFFLGSTFKFFRTPPRACHDKCRRMCDACIKPITGFVYHCEKDDLDLHPCCRNLNRSYRIEDVEFNLHKKVRGKCLWCNKKNIKGSSNDNGWSYISTCEKYHVHVACVTQMALEEWHKSGGDCIADQDQPLALENVNLNEIRARGRDGGNKFWRIFKVFIKTIVSIVLGDPTTILASLFVELIAPP